ncbi:MAG TPA: PQQ-dependent sugar dehydrogenase [Verrucomicrobiales bacterium]|nr:PQQ-dependent sugar dehydrogenase [Verrucomicrobiales bacterium]
MRRTLILIFTLISAMTAAAAPDGPALYRQHCMVCHQTEGQGVPGVFPPLAASDFLTKERERSLRALMEGLTGEITVKGAKYNGAMPLLVLSDEEIATLMTWIGSSMGNSVPAFTVDEVTKVRAKTKYKTFASLNTAHGYNPLPPAPAGWSLKEATVLPIQPVRMVRRPDTGDICILAASGEIWSYHPDRGTLAPLLMPKDYIKEMSGGIMCIGLCFDRKGRLWVTGNQTDRSTKPIDSVVTVWRSQPLTNGAAPAMNVWMQVRYPHGIGGFNHGVSHIMQGPDGMMYISSGSRTDGNEPGNLKDHYTGGEVYLTACLWRVDPESPKPYPAIWCRGLRNPYGFCFDPSGRLWCTDNGPDADRPEELNLLERGKHYGFPYQFAQTSTSDRPYAYTPPLPEDLTVTLPVMNTGPDCGGKSQAAIGTFDPHSSPAGIIWMDGDGCPPADRGTLFTVRYGNLLANKDSGFDLVRVRPVPMPGGGWSAEVKVLAAPLARPIDIIQYAPGRLFIAEYSRGITFAAGISQPGRLLEMKAQP